MQQLEGRIDYTNFCIETFKRLVFPTVAILVGWWLFQNAPANRLVGAWLTSVGSIWMTFAFYGLSDVVSWFRIRGNALDVTTIGRRRKTLPVSSACTFVNRSAISRFGHDNNSQHGVEGVTVGFDSGDSLYFSFRHLSNAEGLIAILRTNDQNADGSIVGGFNKARLRETMFAQKLLSTGLFFLLMIGCFFVAIGLSPRMAKFNMQVFAVLGVVLISIAIVIFYCVVIRFWIGSIKWFRLVDDVLTYRTVFSRKICVQRRDDLQSIVDVVSSRNGNDTQWTRLRFHDGTRVRFNLQLLQNATRLATRLRSVQ